MKWSSSGHHPRKMGEKILAWTYMCLFLFLITQLVLRAMGILPGGSPDWYVWALMLVGLIAACSACFSLPRPINRILWIILIIILAIWLTTRLVQAWPWG